MAMASGGDGDSRVSSGKRVRGGREGAASEGEERGDTGRRRGVARRAGEAGGGARVPTRGDHTPSCLLAGG